jgi:hypothetical protein
MILKRVFFLALLVFAFSRLADAKKRSYEKATLIDVLPKYIESPLPGIVLLPPPQVLVGYSFEIQVSDFTYFVNAAMCCPLKSQNNKPEWTVGDPIEFRFDKDKMLVKRPNGKELNARLVKVVHGTASPSLSPPSRASAPQFPLPEEVQHGKTLQLGMDFLRADDMCLILYGDVEAGDFFDHLRGRNTTNGIQFRKGAQEVKTFPENLIVKIIAVLGACSVRERAAEGGNVASKNVHLDEDFMRSVSFDGSWKKGLAEKPAELGPVAEGRIRNPIPLMNDRDWWEYEFKVRSEGISLNDALVIVMQSPDGKMVARLSARLGSKS